MPQLDISTYSSQLFWLLISFLFFVSCCTFFLIPKLRKNFQTRDDIISSDQKEANENNYKASEVISSVNKNLESIKCELDEKFKREKQSLFKKFSEDMDKIKSDTKLLLKQSVIDINKESDSIDKNFTDQLINELVNQLELKYRK